MFGIKAREEITIRIGLSSELPEDREDKVATALLVFITKIAIEVSQTR
jgi:hypothetical protein